MTSHLQNLIKTFIIINKKGGGVVSPLDVTICKNNHFILPYNAEHFIGQQNLTMNILRVKARSKLILARIADFCRHFTAFAVARRNKTVWVLEGIFAN